MKNLVAALAKARKAFPPIEKTEKAEIGNKYSYQYAPLSEILDKITEPLAENELVLFELIQESEDGTELIVTLAHSSGEQISSQKLMGSYKDPKDFGGAMTYYRRYLIEGLVNIASQQDKDAQGIQSKNAPKRKGKWTPTKDEFFERCKNDFGLEYEQIASILKTNDFKGFAPSSAPAMYNVLKDFGAFATKVREAVPYYQSNSEVFSALTDMAYHYDVENEQHLFDALADRADKAIDSKAAAQD